VLGPSPWSAVLADREYRGLWLAYGTSLAGDQLAAVALTVLVYDATRSTSATAAAYATTLVPWLVGGPLLAGLGDRYPRRTVMVSCHLSSAALVAAMALPGLSLLVLCGLLFVVVLLASPFAAARAALMRDVFPDDRYAAATALTNVTGQTAQVLGYSVGGVLVAAFSPRQALLLDAVTFGMSALIVRTSVRARPAVRGTAAAKPGASLRAGMRLVFGNPWLRTLTWYAWLAAFYVAPTGVVVPYVAQHGGGPAAVGVLLAASSLGTAASVLVITRWVPQSRRMRLLPPLAILATAPLIGCAADPGVPVTALLWLVAGVGTGYQLAANVAFVSAVPNERRAQAFGLVSSGLIAGQGAAILAAGGLAEILPPHIVIAVFALVGTGLAAVLAVGYVRQVT